MTDTTKGNVPKRLRGAIVPLLALATGVACAQDAATGSSAGTGSSGAPATISAPAGPAGPGLLSGSSYHSRNPYYLGASEGLTYESNLFHSPSAKSGFYSTTSLLGGFDQRLSRQRIFADARVGYSKYFGHSELDHTSYGLATGLDWETIGKLSGNVRVALDRNLAAPVASGVTPTNRRNIVDSQRVDARARWGGESLLTLEGTVGYSKVSYTDPTYVASESKQDSASLGVYYRPGGFLRLGVAGRYVRTETPKALFDPASGSYSANDVKSRNLDLTADYVVSGLVTAGGRVSYTTQTNSNPLISEADFSGLTGSLYLTYQPKGKLTYNLYAARDATVNNSPFNGYVVEQVGQTPVIRLESGLYQNHQLTNVIGIGVGYAATGKIAANAGLSYARDKLIATRLTGSGSTVSPDTTDVVKTAFIGADYAIAVRWGLQCRLGQEWRDVSGGVTYSYTDTTIGCVARYTWP